MVADNYRSRFEPYRKFYEENELLVTQDTEEADHGWCLIRNVVVRVTFKGLKTSQRKQAWLAFAHLVSPSLKLD